MTSGIVARARYRAERRQRELDDGPAEPAFARKFAASVVVLSHPAVWKQADAFDGAHPFVRRGRAAALLHLAPPIQRAFALDLVKAPHGGRPAIVANRVDLRGRYG